MNKPLKVKAIFFKDYKGALNTPKIPKGTVIQGYLSQPLDTLVFYSSSVCYSISCITQYAQIEVIE